MRSQSKFLLLIFWLLFATSCSINKQEKKSPNNFQKINLSLLQQNKLKSDEFLNLINNFNKKSSDLLLKNDSWIDGKKTKTEVINILKNKITLNDCKWNNLYGNISSLPYALKLIVPKDSNIFVCGDLHGNFNSLIDILNDLKSKKYLSENLKFKKNNYLIFLGDYTDHVIRKHIPTIATLMILKINNPKNVFLSAGNHEEIKITKKGGLGKEIRQKYISKELELLNSINTFYNLLPSIIYLGYMTSNKNYPTQIYQLNHGSIDIRYNPQKLLNVSNNKEICFSEIDLMSKQEIEKYLPQKVLLKNIESNLNIKDKTFGFRYNHVHIHNLSTLREVSDILPEPLDFKNPETITLYSQKMKFLTNFLRKNTPEIFIKIKDTNELSMSSKLIKDFSTQISTNKNKIVGLIHGHNHYIPKLINKNKITEPSSGVGIIKEKLDTFPHNFKIITLISGQEVPYLLKYKTTYLKLSPPSNDKEKWNIQIINL